MGVDYHVPYGRSNASVRVRVHSWVARSLHDDIVVHDPHTRQRGRPDSTSVVFRSMFRTSRGRTESRRLRAAQFGIYELDDGLPWDDGKLPDLGRWWKRPFPRSLIAQRSAAAADRVIVGNETLGEWAATICCDVRMIPTCVEPDDYLRRDPLLEPVGPDGRFVIGWMGSPATQHYLRALIEPLRVLAQSIELRLELVGAVESDLPPGLRRYAEVIPWSERVASERPASWSVGVMPLTDGPYERAKCGYKLLQYAAAGVPAIGSPVGVNRSILSRMGGFSPRSTDEWIDAFRHLITAPAGDRAARAGLAAETAERFSFGVWEAEWRRAVGLADTSLEPN